MEIMIICGCVLLLAALLAFLIMPGKAPNKEAKSHFYGVNHAHRGLHDGREKPENSLAAIEAAVEAGYGIEMDVQFSKDKQVLVFHDDDLERVCGVKGRVDEYTYDELKNMPLLGTDERIPTLLRVLELVNGRVPLIVELKTGPNNAELCAAVFEILEAYNGPFCIESFDPRIVAWFRKNAPHIFRGQLAAPPDQLDRGIAGCIIAWGFSGFMGRPHFIAYQAVRRPLFIYLAQKFAMRVVWTVTPEHDREAFEKRADAVIFENYLPPVRFKAAEFEPTPPVGGPFRRF